MGLHVMHLRPCPELTAEERARSAALPRPNPPMGGKVVIRRRPGKDPVRVPRAQAALLKD